MNNQWIEELEDDSSSDTGLPVGKKANMIN